MQSKSRDTQDQLDTAKKNDVNGKRCERPISKQIICS